MTLSGKRTRGQRNAIRKVAAIRLSLFLLLLAPLRAQDEAPAGAFAGGGGAQVFTRVDAVNPMDQVKACLGKANITLNSDQEKTSRPAVEAAPKQFLEIGYRRRVGGEEIR